MRSSNHGEASIAELARRKEDHARGFGTFGISYLDDALGGIRPTDLIVIGARTGVGKSELGTLLAKANSILNRRVTLIALEAEQDEMLRRMKYQLIATAFFERRDKFPKHISLNYTDWLLGKFLKDLNQLETWANDCMDVFLENLDIYCPQITEFTKDDFVDVYLEYVERHGTQLVILDHLHYIAPQDRENEYDNIRKVMWRLRDVVNQHRVPVIAMSHLRKESRRESTVIPTLEDIHGSSEISKQANHVITFAPIYTLKNQSGEPQALAPGQTVCRVLKTRTGHAGCDRYAAIHNFDLARKEYGATYSPYKTDRFGSDLFPMGVEDFEKWMGGARPAKGW